MPIRELSVLLPSYNNDCRKLMSVLCAEAEALEQKGVRVEIIVYDDCSPMRHVATANSEFCAQHRQCRFVQGVANVGRSQARNRLVRESVFDWLLFIDSDLLPSCEDFLTKYMSMQGADAFVGGLHIPDMGDNMRSNLRYLYEQHAALRQTAEMRQRSPYAAFHVSNLLVRRCVMESHPFDESICHYGYEDVLLGKQLQMDGVKVMHIDNPVCFGHFDDNASFLAKTEEGLRTLYVLRDKLRGFSGIQKVVEHATQCGLAPLLRLAYRAMKNTLRGNLVGDSPSLMAFLLYRIGYYASLYEKQN